MRRLIAAVLILTSAQAAPAADIWKSSHTTSNETTAAITSTWTIGIGVLHAVVVSSPGVLSQITLYDARSSTGLTRGFGGNGVIGPINTTTARYIEFDTAFSSGLTYTTSATGGEAAGVTMLYSSPR